MTLLMSFSEIGRAAQIGSTPRKELSSEFPMFAARFNSHVAAYSEVLGAAPYGWFFKGPAGV
jgi:hypothetical protein